MKRSEIGRVVHKTWREMDVGEKLQRNHYATALPYPKKPVEPKTTGDLASASDDEIKLARTAKKEYEDAVEHYKSAVEAYNADVARLEASFRLDLEVESGMKDHPKADLLYSKAWANGHASGYADVRNVYLDLLELVR